MPAVTGWITGMDEITVAALWEGSKRYVERHAAEFGLTEENLSAAQSADGGAARSSPTEGLSLIHILPILSAQGAAEAMGQSAEKGESAGKALGGGLAKFGAGWAINSVGAADLAKTMGSDYAKDTLAGQIADRCV